MRKKDLRHKVWMILWKDLRLEYLLLSFAVALATACIIDDILILPSKGGSGLGRYFKYAVAVTVTISHAIGKTIWNKGQSQNFDADCTE